MAKKKTSGDVKPLPSWYRDDPLSPEAAAWDLEHYDIPPEEIPALVSRCELERGAPTNVSGSLTSGDERTTYRNSSSGYRNS